MKNINKPMKIPTIMHYDEFNEYHGTYFYSWKEIWAAFGVDWSLVGRGDIKIQPYYENWLKTVNTPLYRALKEDDK